MADPHDTTPMSASPVRENVVDLGAVRRAAEEAASAFDPTTPTSVGWALMYEVITVTRCDDAIFDGDPPSDLEAAARAVVATPEMASDFGIDGGPDFGRIVLETVDAALAILTRWRAALAAAITESKDAGPPAAWSP
jgi:hypothetical protein